MRDEVPGELAEGFLVPQAMGRVGAVRGRQDTPEAADSESVGLEAAEEGEGGRPIVEVQEGFGAAELAGEAESEPADLLLGSRPGPGWRGPGAAAALADQAERHRPASPTNHPHR